MAEVIWEQRSLTDLQQIIGYIEEHDPRAADRIGVALFDLGESLADFPRRGRLCADATRELTTVPPYVLRYSVVGDHVTILSIRHGARRPRE